MATAPPGHPHEYIDWGYALGWLAAGLLLGYGTYIAVVSNPATEPLDRRQTDNQAEVGRSVIAKHVLIQAPDPVTNAVRWELRVPAASGGIESMTTLEAPTVVIYPGGQAFTVTAHRGTLAEAPVGAQHAADNIKLTLEGPIAGQNADRSEWFEAADATWDGASERLELRGSPLTVVRAGMTMQAERLVVEYGVDGQPVYTLSGGVHLESGR